MSIKFGTNMPEYLWMFETLGDHENPSLRLNRTLEENCLPLDENAARRRVRASKYIDLGLSDIFDPSLVAELGGTPDTTYVFPEVKQALPTIGLFNVIKSGMPRPQLFLDTAPCTFDQVGNATTFLVVSRQFTEIAAQLPEEERELLVDQSLLLAGHLQRHYGDAPVILWQSGIGHYHDNLKVQPCGLNFTRSEIEEMCQGVDKAHIPIAVVPQLSEGVDLDALSQRLAEELSVINETIVEEAGQLHFEVQSSDTPGATWKFQYVAHADGNLTYPYLSLGVLNPGGQYSERTFVVKSGQVGSQILRRVVSQYCDNENTQRFVGNRAYRHYLLNYKETVAQAKVDEQFRLRVLLMLQGQRQVFTDMYSEILGRNSSSRKLVNLRTGAFTPL